MADQASPPQPPIFNLNAYSPAEIKEAIEKVGVKKTNLPFLASLMLAVIAGGSIGLGALYYTIIVSDAELSFATARVMGGLAFSLGLAIVLVGGAELFTGNNLIVMAWASGDSTLKRPLLGSDSCALTSVCVASRPVSVSRTVTEDPNATRSAPVCALTKSTTSGT